jgi:hypothetical protein
VFVILEQRPDTALALAALVARKGVVTVFEQAVDEGELRAFKPGKALEFPGQAWALVGAEAVAVALEATTSGVDGRGQKGSQGFLVDG